MSVRFCLINRWKSKGMLSHMQKHAHPHAYHTYTKEKKKDINHEFDFK